MLKEQKVLWSGNSTQWVNSNKYFACILLILFVYISPSIWHHFLALHHPAQKSHYILATKILFFCTIFYALINFLKVKTHRYELTEELLIERKGILTVTSDEVQLYRVKTITVIEPFQLRCLGCGNVVLDTSDRSMPIIVIFAVKDPKKVAQIVRDRVEHMRVIKGVRELD